MPLHSAHNSPLASAFSCDLLGAKKPPAAPCTGGFFMGVPNQNSVFECEVDPNQWVMCKNQLLEIYEPQEDSLRFYMLGSKGRSKIEHHGAKTSLDISKDAIVI